MNSGKRHRVERVTTASLLPGYTWNPTGGCMHGCTWQMPDGSITECYAKTIAERFTRAYYNGFEHHYWRPHSLNAPLKVKDPRGHLRRQHGGSVWPLGA